jgi:hypothetical protein
VGLGLWFKLTKIISLPFGEGWVETYSISS